MIRLAFNFFLCLLATSLTATPSEILTETLTSFLSSHSLKGLQLQINVQGQPNYTINRGFKNDKNQLIDNDTIFRIASVSKSFASVALLQLIEQGKFSLRTSISDLLGYQVINPFYPAQQITIEMLLSHQSSLIECDPYYNNFLMDGYNAVNVKSMPSLKEILLPSGKYYNTCLFSKTHSPGTYFQYVNLNFGIAGTIVEKVSNIRFDIYARDNILIKISEGLTETATFSPWTIKDPNNLGVLFNGVNKSWVPSADYYPSGVIPQRNLTGYTPGYNAVIFGPQGSLRASVAHLNKYISQLFFSTDFNLRRILSSSSIVDLFRPRYNYHGAIGGAFEDFHLYGLGMYSTSYYPNDHVFDHEVMCGHTGSAYNLISAVYYSQQRNASFAYIVNGALNGYHPGKQTIYEEERQIINKAVMQYLNNYKVVEVIA